MKLVIPFTLALLAGCGPHRLSTNEACNKWAYLDISHPEVRADILPGDVQHEGEPTYVCAIYLENPKAKRIGIFYGYQR